MNRYSVTLILFSVFLALCASGCVSSFNIPHADYPRNLRGTGGTTSVIFASDTQSPIWIEKFFIRPDDNELATQKIFDAISRDSTCAAMFHIGDITAMGAGYTYWEEFDRISAPVRDAHIPIYPAFGNHEYMPWEDDGIYNMVERFPFLTTSWYVRRIGPLAVVILNSNFSHLSAGATAEQERWYEQTLKNLDDDTTVSAVIVGCHHPPYTNSTIVSPSREVERVFVPPYVKSRKAMLFVSGHAHAFEHFNQNGKDFLVIGGGGGLLHPLLTGGEQRWPDRVVHETNRSFFHYVRVTPRAGRLAVEVFMLNPDFNGFRPAYSFELPSNVAD
jgi:hypothetical protein